MRLIDADALKEQSLYLDLGLAVVDTVVVSDIDNAPTIYTVKHGHWIKKYIDQWRCSECGRTINIDEYDDRNAHLYCRYCGTKMYEEVSD